MQQLHLVGFTADNRGLIFSARKGAKSGGFVVTLDDKTLARVDEVIARREAEEQDNRSSNRPKSGLSPREIQARLRAGRTIAQVAREAGVEDEWVARWAAPIAAEQSQVVERAQGLTMEKGRVGPSAVPLGESVRWNMADKGIVFTDAGWTGSWEAFHLRTNSWMVRFTYLYRRATHQAEWEVDTRDALVISRNRQATELGYVAPGSRRPKMPRSMLAAVDLPSVAPALPPSPGTTGTSTGSASAAKAPPARRASKKKTSGAKNASARTAAAKKKWAAIKKAADRQAAADRVAARKEAVKKAAAAKQEAVKRAAAKETAAKKAAAARAAKKVAAKKAAAEKSAAKKSAAKKVAAKKAEAKKAEAKKAAAKKAPAKRPATKKSAGTKRPAKKARTAARPAKKSTKAASATRASVRRASGRRAPTRPTPTKTAGRPAVARPRPTFDPPRVSERSGAGLSPRSTNRPSTRPAQASSPRPSRRAPSSSERREPRPSPRTFGSESEGPGRRDEPLPERTRDEPSTPPTRTPIRIDSGVPRRSESGGPPIIRADRADQSREEPAGVGARSAENGASRPGRFRFRRGRSRN